jgi:small-conductance mechanosensitive channel
VLALALQSPVENFVASLVLQSRRPFSIGDTIEIDGTRGIVVDIDSRTTRLTGLDGTQVRMPNSAVLADSIINLTRDPARRSSLTVGVAYDTDLQRAADALTEATSRVPRVLADPPPTVNLDGFGDSSIGFRILFWHASDVPSELAARNDLVLAVHQALSTQGITIAFPQMVVWSGADAARPYPAPLDRVYTPYPGLADTEPGSKRRAASWRRSARRSDG